MLPKKTLIFILILALVGSIYFLFFSGDSFRGEPVEFIIFNEGDFGGYEGKGNFVIRNTEEWQGAWEKLHSNIVPQPKPPIIDFSKNVMIVIFSGEKPTGGYSVSVSSIKESSNSLFVFIKESRPGQNCQVTQAITKPYTIIQTDFFEGEVIFEVKEVIYDC